MKLSVFAVFFALALPFQLHAATKRTLWIPRTAALTPGQMQFDLQTRFAPMKSSSDSGVAYHETEWGISGGVIERGPVGLEMALSWFEPTADDSVAALGVGLKIRAMSLETNGFSIAVGIDRLGFKSAVSDYNIIYGVIETRITENWRTLVGGYNGNSQLLRASVRTGDPRGVLFGLWRLFDNRKGEWAFEFQSGTNQFGFLMAGAELLLREEVHGYIGLGLAGNRTINRDQMLMRLSIDY